jgi:hypothetical protein
MNATDTNLDRLHDLVLPPVVPWWPPAPGWYVVIALALAAAAWAIRGAWKRWRSNAYRREATRELASLDSSTAIADLLRRTALAIAPRAEVAEMTGASWLDWLDRQCPEAMPDIVRELLTTGVYGRSPAGSELGALRHYAARWIALHPSPRC